MIHPSYKDLMNAVNAEVEPGEEPVVNSRYSIVVATAKRARQLIDGAEPLVTPKNGRALSTAVDEIYQGKVKIINGDVEEESVDDITDGLEDLDEISELDGLEDLEGLDGIEEADNTEEAEAVAEED